MTARKKSLLASVHQAVTAGAESAMADETMAPVAAPVKSTPKAVEPLTMDNLRSRLTKKEIAALDEHKQASEIVNKINLIFGTDLVGPVPAYFKLWQRASKAYGPIGSVDVPALEAVYADVCEATDTTADGLEWDPVEDYKLKRGNFYRYCNFMKKYQVWAAPAAPKPTAVKKSKPKKVAK